MTCRTNLENKQENVPQYRLEVFTAKQPNLHIGSYPNTLISLRGSNNNIENSLIWDPQSHTKSQMKDNFQPLPQKISANGILGSFAAGGQLVLLVVDQVEEAGSILSHTIYKIKRVNYIPLSLFKSQKESSPVVVEDELQHYKELLENGEFHFSHTYPIWNHFQNYCNQTPYKTGFDRYVWNSHMLGNEGSYPGLIYTVRGYFKSTSYSNGIVMTVSSKIDKRNAGTRYTSRGLNQDGIAAISVETEIILSNDSAASSYVQYRGSLPLKWSQDTTDMFNKPPVTISESDNEQLIKKHLTDLEGILPGKPIILNLIGRTNEEKRLSNVLESHLNQINANIEYYAIPLGWGVEALSDLLSHMNSRHRKNNFAASLDEATGYIRNIHNNQVDFIRTNCLDCLDRTAIAQFGITSELFPSLLNSLLGDNPCKSLFINESELYLSLCNEWADMSNAIACYYAGTGVINEALIRYGDQGSSLSRDDMLICSSRYIQNTTFDIIKKYWLDRFLNLSPLPQPVPSPSIPLYHLKYWSHLLEASQTIPSINHHTLKQSSPEELRSLLEQLKQLLLISESLMDYCQKYSLDKNVLLQSLPLRNPLFPRL